MENIIFEINKSSNNHSFERKDSKVITLNSLEEIFSTPFFQTDKNAIVHLTIHTTEQLNSILEEKNLRKINCPIVFQLDSPNPESIEKLFQLHYTNIFTSEQPIYLINKFITYMFDNYHLFVSQKSNRFLDDLDTGALTKKELEIIKVIAESPARELHRDEIYMKIWGSKDFNTNTLDVHLCNLRRKLKLSSISLASTENGKVAIKELSF
jgi:hypothetical protein